MFTMTPRAEAVVRRVTAHPALAATSGLRIAARRSHDAPLKVVASARPEPEDEVVERDGTRVFLGPRAVERVRGRLLDVVTERTGRVQFVLKTPS